MRLGLFGGSFDPVHFGHLRLAACCRDQAGLDEVWFVPAAVQPFKRDGPVASDAQRCEMIRLAIADTPGFALSTIEIDRGGTSYTVDTLRELHRRRPGDEMFFLMGADTLRDLPGWREPDEVLRLATPLVVQRPGEPPPDSVVEHVLVTMPPVDVSSSEIRRRLAAGELVDEMLPEGVLAFARAECVYRGRGKREAGSGGTTG